MSRNAKGTPGWSLSRAARKTKGVEVMLTDERRAKLEALAEAWSCTKSEVVSRLLDGA